MLLMLLMLLMVVVRLSSAGRRSSRGWVVEGTRSTVVFVVGECGAEDEGVATVSAASDALGQVWGERLVPVHAHVFGDVLDRGEELVRGP